MANVVYSSDYDMYKHYEKQYSIGTLRRCIDGSLTGSNKCIGYCRYSEHPGFVTQKLQREHDCISKNCFHYVSKNKPMEISCRKRADISQEIFAFAQKLLANNEFIKVLRVKNIEYKQYCAYYVTITNDYSLNQYASLINAKLGIHIQFERLNYDFDKCVALLYAC